MNAIMCVGGPLHGLKRAPDARVYVQPTLGGPDGQGLVYHQYDIQLAYRNGRPIYWWRWRMKPRWSSAGIMGPRR